MEFIDLKSQYASIKDSIDGAVARVLSCGNYIQGDEVTMLERRLAEYSGVQYVVTCANGTDALVLVLKAWGIGPGDAVVVPSFTFAATAEAVCLAGATPIFVDVDLETFLLQTGDLQQSVRLARQNGLQPKAVIPVDVFGVPCCTAEFLDSSRELGLLVLLDGAQSFGASLEGEVSLGHGDASTTSFFPAKPLGCYGDGGAIFTNDKVLADQIRSLCVHGKGKTKYENVIVGCNSRLDTLQAAILLEKLKVFDWEMEQRQVVARRYRDALGGRYNVQYVSKSAKSSYAQFTLRADNRDRIREVCQVRGIPTQVYYPIPLSSQLAYKHFPVVKKNKLNSAQLSETVISIPMHPYLTDIDQDFICEIIYSIR